MFIVSALSNMEA